MPAIWGWGCVFLQDSGLYPCLLQFPELVINDEAERGISRVCKWHGHGQECLWEHNHFAVLVSRELSGTAPCHDPSSGSSAWLQYEIYLSWVSITFNLCCAIFIQRDILKFVLIKEFLFRTTYDFLVSLHLWRPHLWRAPHKTDDDGNYKLHE